MKSFLTVAKFVEESNWFKNGGVLSTLVSLAMCVLVNEMGKRPLSRWLVKHGSNLYS